MSAHRPDVPPELDQAILVCLARDPADRYPSTVEMARALDAGLEGHSTDVTRQLAEGGGTDPTDATRALADTTGATRALRTGSTGAIPAGRAAPLPPRPATGTRARDRAEDDKSRRKRGLGSFLALLAVLLAAVAITLALVASGDGGGDSGIDPVEQGDVEQQIDGMKQFLRENSR